MIAASRPDSDAYPHGAGFSRVLRVGGISKAELLIELHRMSIRLNEAALTLFEHDGFTTSASAYVVTTIEVSVGDLGCLHGATIAELHARAQEVGLALCPLEIAPHLRLTYLEQPEGHLGHPVSSHRAPAGSLTVASQPLVDDDTTPKGFYLRRIAGTLWLRGYRSGAEHTWSPEDHFVFCRS